MMNKRYIIAAIFGILGFLLFAGAVGSMEFDDKGFGDVFVNILIGAALLAASVPVSGDLKRGDNDDNG
ncbi:MAG TPA: hypothetical protein DER68_06635 [Ruminococcaceae bacterium]|nr:hypothetical protein [Oscillospiraceae bacterium]